MIVKTDNQKFDVQEPDYCPHCHQNIKAVFLHFSKYQHGQSIGISLWICPSEKCSRIIIVKQIFDRFLGRFKIERFLDGTIKAPEWPKPILDLKLTNEKGEILQSKFIKAYSQSLEAEQFGLDELAGMGYRKAIEYLVKDWAIKSKPEDNKKIEDLWLGEVIKNYYDGDLKEILERATWLGNDQSHYKKLFEEYDISTLKELIDLIVVELDRQYKKKIYIESIKKRK
jgi:hypothetical protein